MGQGPETSEIIEDKRVPKGVQDVKMCTEADMSRSGSKFSVDQKNSRKRNMKIIGEKSQ